jgi:hypothetical protein
MNVARECSRGSVTHAGVRVTVRSADLNLHFNLNLHPAGKGIQRFKFKLKCRFKWAGRPPSKSGGNYRRYLSVTAPSLAVLTCAAYFASTPRV